MDAVSGIYGGGSASVSAPGASFAPAQTPDAAGLTQMSSAGNITLASLSSTSISASVESFIGTYGPAMSNKDLLGAVLLLLTLQYLQSQDPDEKKQLLNAITSLAGQQGDSGSGGSFAYSASSLSIESSQLQVVSIDSGSGGFMPGGEYLSSTGGGAAGLDVVA